MSKYIKIKYEEISKEALLDLSSDKKKEILNAMSGETLAGNLELAQLALGVGIETDDSGQIILYTDMKMSSENTVVSLNDALDGIVKFEKEEEEEEEPAPETLRMSELDKALAIAANGGHHIY